MLHHRTLSAALSALILTLLPTASASAAGDPPPPAAVVQQCIQDMNTRVNLRENRNETIAGQTVNQIEMLLEACAIQHAYQLAEHRIALIRQGSENAREWVNHRAAHCTQYLLQVGALHLVPILNHGRENAVATIAESRQAAVSAIASALPHKP